MKIISRITLLIGAYLFYSCQTEKLEPRKNPRFSMAFVQELNLSGAEFAANVYEFGDEEVLEYGFVYGREKQPRIGRSDYISENGKPPKQFSIKATHSMVNGVKYNVSAFMRTSSSYVYSEPVEFESRGSSGFVFQSIEIPDEVYFNDTITVFASDLSRVSSNYSVLVENQIARVVELGDDYFKFLMPYGIEFKGRLISENVMNFRFTVAGKSLEISAPYKFKDPEFIIIPNQSVNYDERVFVGGDYLESPDDFKVFYTGSLYMRRPVSGITNSKTSISFMPSVEFTSSKPSLTIEIRGRSYFLENVFELNPTDFFPGQEFSVRTSEVISARVSNKNFYNDAFNTILAKDGPIPLDLIGGTNSAIDELRFVLRVGEGLKRTNRLYIGNFGEFSSNYITVNITDPIFRDLRVPERYLNTQRIQLARGVSSGADGYFFTGNDVFHFNPERQTFTLTTRFQSADVFQVAGLFALRAPNGLIYTGSDNMANNTKPLDFFEFNPVTESLKALPKIPTTATSPLAVYATDTYLYYDGGFQFIEGVGVRPSNERWRYSFSSRVWDRVEDDEFEMGLRHRNITFNYNGKLFMISHPSHQNPNNQIWEFDENTQKWNFKQNLDLASQITSNEVFVFGDTAYLILMNGLVSIDMTNYQTMVHSFISANAINSQFRPLQSVGLNGKIYIHDGVNFIWEFSPELF